MTAGLLLGGRDAARAVVSAQQPATAAKRREVFVGGAASGSSTFTRTVSCRRLRRSCKTQGIDIQAVNINAWWYAAERELARDIVHAQNEGIAKWCQNRPDRFVGMASVALQDPQLAADQLDDGVRKVGLRGPVGIDFVLTAPFLSDADKEAILGANLIGLLRVAF